MNNKKIGDLNFSSNILNNIVDSIKNLNDNSYLPAVFLLIITISGNFLAETFSCSIRQLLENNYIAKNILLFFLIFFTSSINANSHESPLVKLRKAFIIYIFFIMFSKMNLFFTIIGFAILCCIYISNDYYNFLTFKKEKIDHNYDNFQDILRISLIIWTLVGFIVYFLKQKRDHKNNFNLLTFFIGKKFCQNKNRFKN